MKSVVFQRSASGTKPIGDAGNDIMAGGSGADKILARDGEVDFLFIDYDDEVEKDDIDAVFP